MTKKDLARILTLYKKGFDRKMCIQAIIETSKSSHDASLAIDEFMTTIFEESWELKKRSLEERYSDEEDANEGCAEGYDKYTAAQKALMNLGWSEASAIELIKGGKS